MTKYFFFAFSAVFSHTVFAVANENRIRLFVSPTTYYNVFETAVPAFEKQTGIPVYYVDIPGTTTKDLSRQFGLDKVKTIKLEDPDATKDGKRVNSPTMAIHAVIKGTADAGAISTNYSETMKTYVETFKENADKVGKITQRTIGNDRIIIIMNKANGIAEMSFDDIQNVFAGKVTNWKDLGGANLGAKLVLDSDRAPRTETLRKIILKERPMVAPAASVKSADEQVDYVLSTPGGFGFLSFEEYRFSAKKDQIYMPKTVVIGRPITMVTYGRPNENMLKLIQFIDSKTKPGKK